MTINHGDDTDRIARKGLVSKSDIIASNSLSLFGIFIVPLQPDMKHTLQIGGRECLLYAEGEQQPQLLLIQTLGAQELCSIDSEVTMISEATGTSFVMAAFTIGDWEVELTPWHDPAVSKRQAVGEHALDTLNYITGSLIPYLKERFGSLPVILGGYSLGGLFSRWAASKAECFEAVAAVSPSLWIDAWCGFSDAHAVYAHYVYLSLGDREEHSRNKAIAQVGNNVRWEHEHLKQILGPDRTTLEWNTGNHFMDSACRTAKGFAWCIGKIKNSKL